MSATVTVFIAMSLDGFIAGPGDEIDWLFTEQDYGFTPFFDQVDTLIMGRRTYAMSCSFDSWPYPNKRTLVWTRQAPPPDPRVSFTSANLPTLIARARSEGSRGIWLVGGGELVRSALQTQVVDAFTIAIHPIVLGGGIPLFPAGTPRQWLTLTDCEAFASGLLIARYRVPREPE